MLVHTIFDGGEEVGLGDRIRHVEITKGTNIGCFLLGIEVIDVPCTSGRIGIATWNTDMLEEGPEWVRVALEHHVNGCSRLAFHTHDWQLLRDGGRP